jgi:hypothetical protein
LFTKKFEPRYPSSLRYGAAGLGSYKKRILNALLAGEFPPGQQLFNFSADYFACLLAVAVLHEEFVVARVFVPDVRDDGQPQGLRLEIFRRRRASDAA